MPRQPAKVQVDMFPFLSVLCSVIGVMMLFMMMVMSTRVIEAEQQIAHEPAAGKTGSQEGIDAENYERMQNEIAELSGRLARRQQERDRLARLQEELAALVASKTDDFLVPSRKAPMAIELDAPDPVNIVPDENVGVTKKPIFVEVKADGYVSHPGKTLYPPVQQKAIGGKDHFTAERPLTDFLKDLEKRRENEYILLLLHPNGSAAYNSLRGYMLQSFSDEQTERRPVPGGELIITRKVERFGIGVEPFSRDWEFIALKQQQP